MGTMSGWLVIFLMALATYLLRYLPIAVLSQVRLPGWLSRWLELAPVTILAAMLAPTLFMPDGRLDISLTNASLWAAIPTGLVAWRTRSIVPTIVVGMIASAFLQFMSP